MTSEAKPKKRFGVKRWLILGLIALGIYAAFIGPSILKPISPVVVLPAEPTGLHIGDFEITNTIMATLLADLVLILMAFSAWRFYRRGGETPRGIVNILEALVEFMWNTVSGSAGKWARRIFPVVATIFLLIFVANIVKLVPGFESIGYLKQVHEGTGYAPVELFHIGEFSLYTIDKGQPVDVEAVETHTEEAAAADPAAETETGHGSETELCTACEVVPYLRGTATDINFPFALAILTVVLTQVYGFWAQGPKYFEKFFQVKRLVSGGPFGIIDFAVGLLEVILEFAKILSFGFRLFGNVFAGALLLSILGALVAVGVPPILYILEVFFGIIQAYVFFLLATIFLSGATIAHGHEEAH
ncbi:MAG: F0F1 ATP synthase subunit A [Chloroflexi bacterium]|nr:F0F1 ATP synthase subunit A [Chloroflexota bacterium]